MADAELMLAAIAREVLADVTRVAVLELAKPYTREEHGKLENVSGYASRVKEALEGSDAHDALGKPAMKPEEKTAVQSYSGAGFVAVNGWLRTKNLGKSGATAEQANQQVAHLDSVFAKAKPTTKSMNVYRGLDMGAALKPGSEFTDKAYVSTSSDPAVAGEFSYGTKSSLVRVHVPAGSKAVSVANAMGEDAHSGEDYDPLGESGEREVLLPRGSRFRVIGVGDMRAHGKAVVDVELIEHGSKDAEVKLSWDDEVKLSWGRERHVKTEAGAKMYHAPIGTLITFHMRQKAREHHGTTAEAKVHAQQNTKKTAVDGPGPQHTQDPKKGAAAVYPGVKVPVTHPGDTISGHTYKNVPKPTPGLFQQPVLPEGPPQTQLLRGPGGLEARVTGDKVESKHWDGSWSEPPEAQREKILSTWHTVEGGDTPGQKEPSKYVWQAGDLGGGAGDTGAAVLQHFNDRAETAAHKRYTLPDHKGPLTTPEIKDRVRFIEHSVTNAMHDQRSTDWSQAMNAPGTSLGWVFKPGRVSQQRAIVKELMRRHQDVPREGKGLISGGVPGAGKTTILKSLPVKYMPIDADEIKTEMAKRGMVPKLHGLTPMETAPLMHEESRQIAAMLAQAAYGEHRNVAYDITMAGHGTPLKHLDAMRKAGYSDVHAMYTQVSPDTAIQRTRDRYRSALEDWRDGKNELGPRYVSASTITGNASGSRYVFDSIKGKFDGSSVYDTNGSKPKLVSTYTPLTDPEYTEHVQKAEDVVARELAAGRSTDKTQVLAPGVWNPERAEQHNQIVRKMLKGAISVPSQGKAIIAGGLPGAGKTTVLTKHAGIDQRDYLTLSSDDIKEEMAKRGMMPEVKGLTAMETAPLVHEEASHIANMVAHQAYDRKKNVIWDITMSSPGSVQRRLDEMHGAGYKDVRAVFVHIPVETSVQRARDRHRKGLEAMRQGHGPGGRLMPSGIIRSTATAHGNASHDTFTALKDKFDGYKEYDNSGSKPKLVSEHSPPEKHAHVLSAEEIVRRVKSWGGRR